MFMAESRPLDEEGFLFSYFSLLSFPMLEVTINFFRYCTFFDLKFSKPTRLNIANLYFSVKIRFHGGKLTLLRSGPSKPFVVITNESQWGDSEGQLMKLDVFGEGSVSLEYLTNILQVLFCFLYVYLLL